LVVETGLLKVNRQRRLPNWSSEFLPGQIEQPYSRLIDTDTYREAKGQIQVLDRMLQVKEPWDREIDATRNR